MRDESEYTLTIKPHPALGYMTGQLKEMCKRGLAESLPSIEESSHPVAGINQYQAIQKIIVAGICMSKVRPYIGTEIAVE